MGNDIRRPKVLDYVRANDEKGKNAIGVVQGFNSDGTLHVLDIEGNLRLCPFNEKTVHIIDALDEITDTHVARELSRTRTRLSVRN